MPRQDYEKPYKSRNNGAKRGIVLVVRAFGDYSNTTNEGMQMSRCRSADFNGSSNS